MIKLEQNYRSSQRILKVANHLINHNTKVFEKNLWSDHGIGDPMRIYAARDDEHEAESVVMKLMAHKFEHRTRFADYAILYRSNYLSRAFEEQLRAQRVPYTVSGGTSFFDKAEIKDIISYLRLIANPRRRSGLHPRDHHAEARHRQRDAGEARQLRRDAPDQPVRGGVRGADGAAAAAAPVRRPDDVLQLHQPASRSAPTRTRAANCWMSCCARSTTRPGCTTRTSRVRPRASGRTCEDFIGWLKRKAEADEKSLIAMVQTIALINMLEGKDQEPDAVSLSTLHAAKGLEFPHVFIIGAEEDILPFRDSDEKGIEEERRLMYVGITRAERSLQISYCNRRKRGKDWYRLRTEPLPRRDAGGRIDLCRRPRRSRRQP